MAESTITRRDFVNLAAFGAAAAAMATNVAPNLLAATPAKAEEGEVKKLRTMCRACLNNCGMIAHVKDGKVIKLEGDPDDPMNKGGVCAKGLAGIQALYNPNRIKYPMKRIGERGSNQWERISWEQAIDEICDVMWEYYQKEGPKSLVCSTGGGGNPQFFSPARFLSVWGGGNFFEPGCAQCYLPRNHMEFCLNGTADTSLADGPVTEVYLPGLLPEDKCTPTKAYVMWGVGPSYHGTGSTGRVVTDLRNAGMKTVVIDPRLTPDAARADVWLPIRPGTDVALMLAWINYIIENELWDHDFCREWTNLPFLVHEDTRLTYRASELGLGTEDEYVVWDKKTNSAVAMPYPFPADGSIDPEMFGSYELPNGETARTAFQIMKEHVSEWTLEKAAEVCWLEADKIEEAIKIYVEGCPNAGVSLGVATDQTINSAQTAQGDAILDILMGCIRQPGSIVQDRPCYVEPCNYVVQPFGLHHPDHPLRMPEEEANARLGYTEHKGLGHWLASHIPTVLKAIETGEPYRPRIWIERSGNKLAMIGNAQRFYDAMMTTELNVHMYMHWTTTSVCLADYVLPTAEWLETNYAQDRLNTYGIRRACTQLYEAVDECMHWSWLAAGLAKRGHKRAIDSFDPEVAGKFYGTYWKTYEEYMDYVGYFVGSFYYGTEDWDWKTFEAQAPSEYQTIEEYAEKSYNSHLFTDEETGLPVGFHTTSKRCEPYFDGNILLGLTGSIDGKGTMEPATDVFPLSNNYNPLPYYLEPYESPVEGDPGYDPAYPYTLTQGRIPFFHHGTVRNAPWNRELCPVPETWINPETAAEIGIEDGDWLWLESKRGRTQGLARVTKSVAPKVIYQERYWFPELLDSDDPNRAWQAMNINLLTQNNDECPFNDVYGTYVLRGVQINITKADSAPEGVWTDPTDFTPWLPEPSENTGGGNAVYGA